MFALGSVFSFQAEGLSQMAGVTNSFNQMSTSVDGLVRKTTDIGTFFESIRVQIKGLSGDNEKMASNLFNSMAKASTEIPYSFREALSGMREFIMLGINTTKTYGQITTDIGTMNSNAMNSISGLAAKVGAGFEQTAHNIKSAISSGRADYLGYWVGDLEAQMMQMQGVFVGTYQMQFDKVMKYLSKYSKLSADLAKTLVGTLQNMKDLSDQIWVGLLQPSVKGRLMDTIATPLAEGLSKLSDFFLAFTKLGKAGEDMANKLGNSLQIALQPFIDQWAKMIDHAVNFTMIMTRWAANPANQFMVNFLVRAVALGAVLITIFSAIRGAIYLLTQLVKFAFAPAFLLAFGKIALIGYGLVEIVRWVTSAINGHFMTIKETLAQVIGWVESFIAFMTVALQIWKGRAGITDKGYVDVSAAAYQKLTPEARARLWAFGEVVAPAKGAKKEENPFSVISPPGSKSTWGSAMGEIKQFVYHVYMNPSGILNISEFQKMLEREAAKRGQGESSPDSILVPSSSPWKP